jgi:phage repressor protein C with HTH and peptisase S24 domain
MEEPPKTIMQVRLQERMDALGLKAAPLAKSLKQGDSFVRDILRGKTRSPAADSLAKLADALETTADYLIGKVEYSGGGPKPRAKTTTVVGRAGAATDGRVVFAEGHGGLGTVMLPEGAPEDSVAIEVTGYSMGMLADGALLFYSEQTTPSDEMLGLIVIVGTEAGEVLLKRLLRGSRAGVFDLESLNGPTLRDQRVLWAAHIDSLVPPWRAARLRVEASDVGL